MGSLLLSLLDFHELFLTLLFADELGGDRVGEDEHPCRQEDLTTWDQDEQREWHEFDEVFLDLSKFLVPSVGLMSILTLEPSTLCLDGPLTISEQCLESMSCMDDAMLQSDP